MWPASLDGPLVPRRLVRSAALGLMRRRVQEVTCRAKSTEVARTWLKRLRCPMGVIIWASGSHSTWKPWPRVSTGRASNSMKGRTGDRVGTSPSG